MRRKFAPAAITDHTVKEFTRRESDRIWAPLTEKNYKRVEFGRNCHAGAFPSNLKSEDISDMMDLALATKDWKWAKQLAAKRAYLEGRMGLAR
jgi:hypothetical protein